jgi:hypothetical protein
MTERTVFNNEVVFLIHKGAVGVEVTPATLVEAVEDVAAETAKKNRDFVFHFYEVVFPCKLYGFIEDIEGHWMFASASYRTDSSSVLYLSL